MNPFDFAHPPRTLAGTTGGKSVETGDAALSEFPHAGGAVLPLLPDQRSQASPDPRGQRAQTIDRFGETEVAPPATDVLREFLDHLPQTATSLVGGDLPDSVPEALYRFPVDAQLGCTARIGRAESQILPIPGPPNRALFVVHLESQLLLDEATDAFHHSFPCSLASDEDDTVVSVANKVQPAPFELLVELVEDDIGKQRRKRTALWGAFFGWTLQAVDHNPGGEETADEFKHPLVLDPCGQSAHQPVLLDSVEEFRQINVDHIP